ncbi:uncharacterized protein LOC107372095 isoform X1 [Tetranychus urticae]|uniref:uncharacterized protein LOC107372095 isoform X1 n=1 Tax=Tetranychus urticae TaxID=32264 RepID=UPI00077BF5F2|nr:uncharacterized protein LOC107372095 isoform X1 [Tetranychus urticae]XP_015795734.1 uncharacterized protein LOC107372095 isoform X1 [Tetranychus urticae]
MILNRNYDQPRDRPRLYRTHSINHFPVQTPSGPDLYSYGYSRVDPLKRNKHNGSVSVWTGYSNGDENGERVKLNGQVNAIRLQRSSSLYQKQLLHHKSTTDVNHRGERVVALMVKDDSLVGKKVPSTVKWSQPLSLDYCYDDSSIRHTSHAMPKESEPSKASLKSQSVAFDGSQFSASLFKSESRDGVIFGLVKANNPNYNQYSNFTGNNDSQQHYSRQQQKQLPVKFNESNVGLINGQSKQILKQPVKSINRQQKPSPSSSSSSSRQRSTLYYSANSLAAPFPSPPPPPPPPLSSLPPIPSHRTCNPRASILKRSNTCLPPRRYTVSTSVNDPYDRWARPSHRESIYCTAIYTPPEAPYSLPTNSTLKPIKNGPNQQKIRDPSQSKSSSSTLISHGRDLNRKSSCSYCLPLKLTSVSVSPTSTATPPFTPPITNVTVQYHRPNGSLSSGDNQSSSCSYTSSSDQVKSKSKLINPSTSSSSPSTPSSKSTSSSQTTQTCSSLSENNSVNSETSQSNGNFQPTLKSTLCDQPISSNDTEYSALSNEHSDKIPQENQPSHMSPTIIKEVMKNMAKGKTAKITDDHELKENEKISTISQTNVEQIKSCISPNNLNAKGFSANEGQTKENSDSNDENDKNQVNQPPSPDSRPSKPPRKPCFSDSNGFEQQNDNLVEEIYLAAESEPVIKEVQQLENKTETNNLSRNDLSLASKHFVVVAIDFGTTYSGYAFSFTRSPEAIHMMRKWDDSCDPDVNNHKTPTILLLNPGGEFHAFGAAAREAYHGLSSEEAKEWLYFEKFKMTLHTTVHLTKQTQLTAANGKKVAALNVFAHSLRYFKNHALTELSEQCATKIEDEDVRWVVTVPALWRQTAKQFMRMAAYQAGLASPDNPSQLLISPEPEAAAIYCRKLKINQLIPEGPNKSGRLSTNGNLFDHEKDNNSENDQAISIKKGTRYMVVDCGGGTVDITVHEIHDDLRSLKELHRATGCPFGSTGVDREFENLLEDIFGAKFLDDFRIKLPSGYVTLMTTFEGRKRAANTISTTPYNISLPFSFIQSVRKWKGSGVDSIVKKYGSTDISFDPRLGILRLSATMMRKLFEPTCEKIVSQINSILESKNCCSGVCDGTNLGYLFLVGGFAESQLLQSYIRSAFSSRLRVIIPQGVSSSILRGAVLFGLDPSIISVRRSKMTYGIGILNRFIHGYHPLSKLVVRDGVEWCSDIFDKFVLTDQSISSGDIVTRSYTPAKNGQKFTVLNIYCSERDDVRFITDEGVYRCGTLVLDLDDLNGYPDSDGINSKVDKINGKKNIKKINSSQPLTEDQKQRINGKLKSGSSNDDGNTADDDNSDNDNNHESRKKKKESDSPSTTPPPVPPPLPPPSLDSSIKNRGREIQTNMIFGDTEIKVTAIDVQSGRKVRAEIDFLSQ